MKGISVPMIMEVSRDTYLIDYLGMGCGMLFVGTNKALLVDTGCGNSDILKLLKSFVDVSVICAVTHEHADHIGGIGQWKEVYVPALELKTIRSTTREFLQTFLDFFNRVVDEGDGYAGIFKEVKELRPWDYIPGLIPVYDGDTWDLGGRTVTAYRCQVHSKGHMVFVDDQSRIMFGGDSISDNTGPTSNPMNPPTVVSLEDELRGLYNVKKHEDEYDVIWGGHADWGGHIEFIHSFDKGVVDRMIEAGEKALKKELPILHEEGSHGSRSYVQSGKTQLFFFGEYMHDDELPEEFRYEEPGIRNQRF